MTINSLFTLFLNDFTFERVPRSSVGYKILFGCFKVLWAVEEIRKRGTSNVNTENVEP